MGIESEVDSLVAPVDLHGWGLCRCRIAAAVKEILPSKTAGVVFLSGLVVLAGKWFAGTIKKVTRRQIRAAECLALLLFVPCVARPDALVVACSSATPIASLGQTVEVKAFVAAPGNVVFHWTADAGHIVANGEKATWELPQDKPQLYKATVRVEGIGSEPGVCEVSVYALRNPDLRGIQTRRLYLPRDVQEQPGYARYSYLLLGARPEEATRERYLKALSSYSNLLELEKMRDLFPANELNVTFLPLNITSMQKVQNDPIWLLENYDFERARFLLRALPGTNTEGPYIVSYSRPLTTVAKLNGEYLFQDLSSAPPSLVELWVREYENQSAQEQFWKVRSGPMLALHVRTVIGILAGSDTTVRNSIASWIQWVPPR
jgi:hypothetical protein